MAKRIMREFQMSEISAVDRPAQKGARMTIMKRADALTPAELKTEIEKSVAALTATYDEIHADEAAADKPALLQKSFDQFTAHIQGITLEGIGNAIVASSLSEAGFTVNEGGQLSKRDEDQMAFSVKKSLGLPETATDAEVQKALEARGASEELAKFGANVAKMSGEHLAYMKHKDAKLPAGGEQEFAAMTAEKRDAIIKEFPAMSDEDKKKAKEKADAEDAKKREGDEVLKVGGVEIRKSVVGEGPFAVMKTQQDDIAKLRDKDEVGIIEKRVAPLVHIGKADEIAGLLHSISKHDPKLSEAVEKKFTQLEAMIAKGDLFKEAGKSGGGHFGKAEDAIEAKAQEILAKGQAKTIFKARDMARTQNPDLAKQEEQERKEGNKRAA